MTEHLLSIHRVLSALPVMTQQLSEVVSPIPCCIDGKLRHVKPKSHKAVGILNLNHSNRIQWNMFPLLLAPSKETQKRFIRIMKWSFWFSQRTGRDHLPIWSSWEMKLSLSWGGWGQCG
jgi:hypothetical protein